MLIKGKNQITILGILSALLSMSMIVIMFFVPSMPLKIIITTTIFVVNLFVVILTYVLYKKFKKLLKEELKKAVVNRKKRLSLVDVYGVLGITPQYNSDGTLKDVFELLKIKPQYDENGNRILTIYEILNINPRFTQFGIEIPVVFRIKNRINALVKAKEGTIPLYYVPRRQHMQGVGPHLPVPPMVATEKDTPKIQQKQIIQIQTKVRKPAQKQPASKLKYPSLPKKISPNKPLSIKSIKPINEFKIAIKEDGTTTKDLFDSNKTDTMSQKQKDKLILPNLDKNLVDSVNESQRLDDQIKNENKITQINNVEQNNSEKTVNERIESFKTRETENKVKNYSNQFQPSVTSDEKQGTFEREGQFNIDKTLETFNARNDAVNKTADQSERDL